MAVPRLAPTYNASRSYKKVSYQGDYENFSNGSVRSKEGVASKMCLQIPPDGRFTTVGKTILPCAPGTVRCRHRLLDSRLREYR